MRGTRRGHAAHQARAAEMVLLKMIHWDVARLLREQIHEAVEESIARASEQAAEVVRELRRQPAVTDAAAVAEEAAVLARTIDWIVAESVRDTLISQLLSGEDEPEPSVDPGLRSRRDGAFQVSPLLAAAWAQLRRLDALVTETESGG